jgi:hypothetical protein
MTCPVSQTTPMKPGERSDRQALLHAAVGADREVRRPLAGVGAVLVDRRHRRASVPRSAKIGGMDGLKLLRTIFASFVLAIVLIAVAAFLVSGDIESDVDPLAAAGLTGLFGIGAQLVGRKVERPLTCGTHQEVAASYRARFFLRLASSEIAALLGFVLTVLAASPLPYLVGFAVTAVGFARAAPTESNLAKDDEALRLGGCGTPLVEAIKTGATRRT